MNNTSKDYAYYNKMHKIGIWITVISLGALLQEFL